MGCFLTYFLTDVFHYMLKLTSFRIFCQSGQSIDVCSASDGCGPTQFACGPGARRQCIPLGWRGVRDNDCGNNNDEEPEMCGHFTDIIIMIIMTTTTTTSGQSNLT